MTILCRFKPSSLIRNKSLIIGLALFFVDTAKSAEPSYEIVNLIDRGSMQPQPKMQLEALLMPRIISPDDIVFTTYALVDSREVAKQFADHQPAPPPKPVDPADEQFPVRIKNPAGAAALPSAAAPSAGRLSLDPDAPPSSPAPSVPAMELRPMVCHPIYRYTGGKITAVSTYRDAKVTRDISFGISGTRTLYALERGLWYFENGKQTPAPLKSATFPHLSEMHLEKVDVEGDTIAFGGFSHDGFHVFSVRNGVATRVYTDKDPDSFGRGFTIEVGAGRVFVGTTHELFVSNDIDSDRLVARGQQLSGRPIGRVWRVSAAGGKVYFLGVSDRGSAIYTLRDDKPELFADQPEPGDDRWEFDEISSHGDTLAVVERTKATVVGGRTNPNEKKSYRLAIYRDGKRVVVAKEGDDLFGSQLTGLMIGPRAVDAKGSVAFAYELADQTRGVALAKVR